MCHRRCSFMHGSTQGSNAERATSPGLLTIKGQQHLWAMTGDTDLTAVALISQSPHHS